MNRSVRPLAVLVKAVVIFVGLNILYGLLDPVLSLSTYNILAPGRIRFPFKTNSYSVMVDDLDVMFASHRIAAENPPDEFRVMLVGDSSVWGEELPASDSISELWNAGGEKCGGQNLVFYNLSYPHPSVIKDLVIMERSTRYAPDLFIWFVTANSLMPRRINPFVIANREEFLQLLDTYDLSMADEDILRDAKLTFYDKTIIGRRSLIARWIKLQALGMVWSATGAEFHEGEFGELPLPPNDLHEDLKYLGKDPRQNLAKILSLDIVTAGYQIADSTPLLIVNEPISIATGLNSGARYNNVYPRWAYDQYRAAMDEAAGKFGWRYADLWNIIPQAYFSNEFHLTAEGEQLLVEKISPILQANFCR